MTPDGFLLALTSAAVLLTVVTIRAYERMLDDARRHADEAQEMLDILARADRLAADRAAHPAGKGLRAVK